MKSILIILIVVVSFYSTNSHDLTGYYNCNHNGKRINLQLKDDSFCIIKTSILLSHFVDTLKWSYKDGLLSFSEIDTNYVEFNDSIMLITTPERALYADNHILFFQDNSFFVFYSTAIDTGYRTEDFYFVRKQINGEEEKTIKDLFGDSVTIMNNLGYKFE
ncbi:MAG: hypothetical protein JXR53_02225 [Bacteroidales bacterium]|nr:hypothetical protein [Bacteroidales bacterium]